MTGHTPADDAGDVAALRAEVERLTGMVQQEAKGYGDTLLLLDEARAEVDNLRAEVADHEAVYGQMLGNVGQARRERDVLKSAIEQAILDHGHDSFCNTINDGPDCDCWVAPLHSALAADPVSLADVRGDFIQCPHEAVRATCAGICNCPCEPCAPSRYEAVTDRG